MKIVILKSEPSTIFQKKLKKKFLDAVWQYWRYLEVFLDQGGHFLSLWFLIWSLQKNFLQHKLEGYWKYEVLSEYSIPILSFIFQKSPFFFHFSRHIIWLVCRMVMIFLLAQRYNLCKLFRYLEHARKVHRNVSRGFSKKVLLKKIRFCQNILSSFSDKTSFFWAKLFLKSL